MPRPRSAMRKIREVLRLRHAEHLSTRDIAVALAMPRTTVRNYLVRAAEAGLRWPLPADTDDRELEERLFGRAAPPPAIPKARQPQRRKPAELPSPGYHCRPCRRFHRSSTQSE